MKKSDFYELKIGQYIYWRGVEVKIKILNESSDGLGIGFLEVSCGTELNYYGIMHELSFDPTEKPKRKETFWLWSLKHNNWYKRMEYMNDKGVNTEGNNMVCEWDEIEKIKHENEFIEIEVGW